MSGFLVGWLAAIPAYAAPLLLAALGLILSERAGVLNLSAEGVMAIGAMTGAAVVLSGIAPTLGILAGVAAGAGLSLVFAIVVVVFRGDQTLAGLTTVAVGIGLAGVLGRDFVQKPFPGIERFGADAAPATNAFERFFLQQDPLILVALVLVVAVWWFLERTRAGLQLRAVGEDPGTADVAGVDVQMVRIGAVVAGGALCGLSGAYLSVAASHVWVEGMIAGRGWIAVALVIFARWDARRALLGAVIFGAAEALGPRLQAVGAPVPTYLMMMLPYALTLIVLVLSSLIGPRDTAEPAALGSIYLRQDKS